MADASLATGQREAEKAYEEGVERVRTTTACHNNSMPRQQEAERGYAEGAGRVTFARLRLRRLLNKAASLYGR